METADPLQELSTPLINQWAIGLSRGPFIYSVLRVCYPSSVFLTFAWPHSKTTWDRPDGLEGGGADGGGMAVGASWAGEVVVTDDGMKYEQADDGEGNFYWYNSETGVSTWEYPQS